MWIGVIVSVEFIMDYIIDAGGRYLITWLEFIYLFCHVQSLLSCLTDDYCQSVGNNRLGGVTLNFIGASQCLVKGFGMLHVHSCDYFGFNQIGDHDHVVTIEDLRKSLRRPLIEARASLAKTSILRFANSRKRNGFQDKKANSNLHQM